MCERTLASAILRLTVPALVLIGCSQAGMNDAGREMSAALTAADRENDRHESTCQSVDSQSDMMSELERHETAMGGLMTRMESARAHMQSGSMMMSMHCRGSSFDHMSAGLHDMDEEMAAHARRMQSAPSVDDARAECTTHTEAMRETMNGMMDDLDEMPCMQE